MLSAPPIVLPTPFLHAMPLSHALLCKELSLTVVLMVGKQRRNS